jgi:hypothetical protein
MKTLQDKLVDHFKLGSINILHKNLYGWIYNNRDVDAMHKTIALCCDGSIRVGDKTYPVDFPLSRFLAEMEETHTTQYSEMKNISHEIYRLVGRLKNMAHTMDGNGHSQEYQEMTKKIFEGYSETLHGVAGAINAIANHTPSYGIQE